MSAPGQFESIVAAHAAELFRYAYWLARDRHTAEDIVQEALLRGWRAFPQLRQRAAVRSWLYSIVRNEFLRHAGAAALEMDSLDEIDAAHEESHAEQFEMREALMALPAAYAEPLALQVLGGFSCGEIAGMLSITEGAAMTRLTRARQALRRLIEPAPRKSHKANRQ